MNIFDRARSYFLYACRGEWGQTAREYSKLGCLRNLVHCNTPFDFIDGETTGIKLRQRGMRDGTEPVQPIVTHRDRTDTLSESWEDKDGKAPLIPIEKIAREP